MDKIEPGILEIARAFLELLNGIRDVCDKRFIFMENKLFWFDRDVAGIYPQFDKYPCPTLECRNNGDWWVNYKSVIIDGVNFDPVLENEGKKTFKSGQGTPYLDSNNRLQAGASYNAYLCYGKRHGCGSNGYSLLEFGSGKNISCSCSCSSRNPIVLIHRLLGANATSMNYIGAVTSWLQNGLLPRELNDWQKGKYQSFLLRGNLNEIYRLLEYIKPRDDGQGFWLDEQSLLDDVIQGRFIASFAGQTFNYPETRERLVNGQQNDKNFVAEYLQSDTRRAAMSPYTDDQLTDPNKGHWEIYEKITEGSTDGAVQIKLPQPLFARPPQLDIVQNGIVGIDFGTKSTVVACRRVEERLLRVGKGNYSAAPNLSDYENPTVIELRDIDAFRNAYASRDGRPFTEWEQLTVSHQANNALYDKGVDSSVYYSVFGELKQWANDKQRRLLLRDRQGHTLELKPYLELSEGDFDPIEVYAYYLGLYINNMTNGIYLDYILSFPVNYGKEVREHLLVSFQRGLRKSLPPALLRDEEAMRSFRVYAGASEPAAYAICALKELQLEPQEPGQKVSYAVFDFGGGTTDFDFGTEEKPADKRRNFVVHQFGKGGDVYLGGENLLNLMAYEVYKANINEMREKSIPFVLPPDSGLFADSFAGSERLVYEPGKASQQAYMNRKLLAQLLRPIWERQEGYEKLFEQGGTDINLYSLADGKQELAPVKLTVNVKSLEELIEKRIRYGVQNFFQKMNRVFTKKERLEQLPIHILLAGNSCKSPVVRQLFEEAIKQMEQEGAKTLLEQYGTEANAGNLFRLHLPLGMQTGENAPEQAPSGIELDRERTGKTGVVFGLLRSRKGGKDVRIVNEDVDETGEASFSWYLGNLDTEDKFHVVIGLGVGYGAWARFDYADEEDFEIYYTSDSQAPEDKLPASAVKMVRCRLDADEVDEAEEAAIYIRKVAPDAIEYATGRAEDFANPEMSNKVHKQMLR